MKWRKVGLVVPPPPWAATHAQLPFAVFGREERVYFSARDEQGRSRIGWADVDLDRPHRPPLAFAERPLLELGPLGAFDDNGVTGSCIVEHDGRLHLYYTGWSLGVTVPFTLAIGLAVSEDRGRNWARVSEGPVVGRDTSDPYLSASPWVRIEDGLWRMWYVSATAWRIEEGQPRHYYHIRYGESEDGIAWRRPGQVCIDFAPGEYAIARPCVVKDGGLYRMWYCSRGARYRIGYAESHDGLAWRRRDEHGGLAPSPEGWDSEMTAYPFVFDRGGARYMLYNGNHYGRHGTGLAALVEEDAGGGPP